MAKKKQKKHKPGKQTRYFINPEDVLANRVSVRIHDLAELIHRVNPTGETLAASESRERYQLKTRLQSYLVRCFPDHLKVIQPDPQNPDLVSFSLLYSGKDACHALISELEEDARSWTLRYIDEDRGTPAADESANIVVPPKAPGPDGGGAGAIDADISALSVEALMARGQDALEQFDYDTVETCFRQALQKSGGDVTPAMAITEFYVDYLAAYDAALDVTGMFGAPARKDKEIKSLLAIAAARSGRIELALDYADGLTQARNIEVYLTAARHYLETQDPDRAEKMLARAKVFDQSGLHAEIDSLAAEIHQQYSQMLESEEQKMVQAWDAGDIEAAVRLSDQIRRVLPQHETARQIRNEYDRIQRQNRFDALVQQADLARDNQEFKREAECLQKAVKIDNNAQYLYSRLDLARKNAEAQRNARAVADVEAPWKTGDEKTAFLRYLDGNARQRQCVRAAIADGRLEWLEQIRTAGPAVKHEEMVDAVFCLQQAFSDFEDGGDPTCISKALAAYTKTLQPVAAAQKLRIDLESRARAIEWQRNRDRVDRLETGLPAMDLESAKALFSRIRPAQLPQEDSQRYEKIRARLQQIERQQILERRYADAVSQGDDFLARNTAHEMLHIDDPENEACWHDRIQWHTAEIHRKWRVREVDMKRFSLFYTAFGFSTSDIDNLFQLTPDGKHLLMITFQGRLGFLRWYDIADQRFTKGWLFQAPQAMEFPKFQLCDNTLMISDNLAHTLEIELDPFVIRGWYNFENMLRSTDICEDAWIFPRSRRLWMDARKQFDTLEESMTIYSLDDPRNYRTIKVTGSALQLNTGREHYLGMQDERRKLIRMYNEYGKFSFVINQRVSGPCDQLAIHPDGHRVLLLPYRDDLFESGPNDPEDVEDYALCLEIQSRDTASAAWNPVMQIADSNGEMQHEIQTSLNEKLVFIRFYDDQGRQLMCLRPRGDTFDILYQMPLPENTLLAADTRSEHVAAVQYTGETFGVQVLDGQCPVFASDKKKETIHTSDLPSFSTLGYTCGMPGGKIGTLVAQYIKEVQNEPDAYILHAIEKLKKSGSPDDIAAYAFALRHMPGFSGFKLSLDLSDWLSEHYPDHYRSRIHNANTAIREADCQRMKSLLEPIARYDIEDEPSARHICHVLGMAYLGEGRLEQALDIWREGTGYAGDCELGNDIEYAEFALAYRDGIKPLPKGDVARKAGRLFQLYETVNHYRRKKDWIAVIDTIEAETSLGVEEDRLMARQVEAYLNLPDESAGDRMLGKILVLSAFCTKYFEEKNNVILPPYIETPSKEEMADLVKRAEEAVT